MTIVTQVPGSAGILPALRDSCEAVAGEDARAPGCAGQASIEMALIMMTIMIPLTLGIVAIADVVWTYHALVTLTRQGAHYAATHCYLGDNGQAVTDWMKANAPPFLDKPNIGATLQIQVNYWAHDFANNQSLAFSCAGAPCVPDAVTVSIINYQFTHLLPLLHLQPLQVPAFSTTVEVQSAGIDPESGVCPELGASP